MKKIQIPSIIERTQISFGGEDSDSSEMFDINIKHLIDEDKYCWIHEYDNETGEMLGDREISFSDFVEILRDEVKRKQMIDKYNL
tara:strand:- start:51 stop:305 length:255 start_codon:yes stop_codon:yes gene_type:complete